MSYGFRRLFFLATLAITGLALISPSVPGVVFAQSSAGISTVSVNAQDLLPRATAFLSPTSETVLQGTTFNVSVYLNTEGNSVNTLDLKIQFPPDKLAIVTPSGGTSLIQLWLQPPTYSNTNGTTEYAGVIPNGIVTQSGLVATITFRALASGEANIVIGSDSSILANDGFGTQMNAQFGRASYTIVPQPPGGVTVFSPTHPFSSQWYNNNNIVFQWDDDPGVTGFSYLLDNDPNTVPSDTVNTTGTSASFQNLGDGLWYFHIKAQKLGIWSAPTSFLAEIDTQPSAAFTPAVEMVNSSPQNKALISFFTTDALSGIDHYEVAVVSGQSTAVVSPVFIQTESPYELAITGPGTYHVIVRAVDRAGNIRDEPIDVTIYPPFIEVLKEHDLAIISWLLALIVALFLLHYFFGHKLLRRAHKAILAAEREEKQERLEEAERLIEEERGSGSLPPPSTPEKP